MRRLTFANRTIDSKTILVDPTTGEEFFITDMEVAEFYLGKKHHEDAHLKYVTELLEPVKIDISIKGLVLHHPPPDDPGPPPQRLALYSRKTGPYTHLYKQQTGEHFIVSDLQLAERSLEEPGVHLIDPDTKVQYYVSNEELATTTDQTPPELDKALKACRERIEQGLPAGEYIGSFAQYADADLAEDDTTP